MSSIKRLDQDGQPRLGDDAKAIWDAVVEFRDRTSRDRFTDMVLAAPRIERPELFEKP